PNNTYKGISQYRIKQVDIDGHAKYSEIRAVRGESVKAGVVIFPNPSPNGRITVLFEDRAGTRDVSIADETGRTIRQWKGVSSNTIQVENLGVSIYTIRIMISETGMQTVEKFIIASH